MFYVIKLIHMQIIEITKKGCNWRQSSEITVNESMCLQAHTHTLSVWVFANSNFQVKENELKGKKKSEKMLRYWRTNSIVLRAQNHQTNIPMMSILTPISSCERSQRVVVSRNSKSYRFDFDGRERNFTITINEIGWSFERSNGGKSAHLISIGFVNEL